jgi:DNA repair photolyase
MNPLVKKILPSSQAALLRGRGALDNPSNRFESIAYEHDPETGEAAEAAVPTRFFQDHSRSIIAYNDSPDVGFDASINPYRGCEHGCIYCYARPTHEYLGLSAGLDFETQIFVKTQAPQLLRKELSAKKYSPQVIAISGVTDCYQPAERHFQLTRGCLEVLHEFGNPVGIVTKNHLVTRDIDVLRELAQEELVIVYVSVTTLDAGLSKIMEPRASTPTHRLEAIEALTQAGIPAGVMVAPVIPAITESEMPAILHAAARAGAQAAGYVMLRLPLGVAPLFSQWLETHFPDRKQKVLHHIEDIRGGRLNQAEFGKRMRGEGLYAEQVAKLFEISRRKAGIMGRGPRLTTDKFRRPGGLQMGLF